MEVPVRMACPCGRGRPRPRTVYSKIACRAATDFVCDLTRMQHALHIGCHHAVHLDVKELPFQDMAALAAFVPHADFSQGLLPTQSCPRNGSRKCSR